MRLILAAVIGLLLVGEPVGAHHSYAGFVLDRSVTVEGTLERLRYANPHTLLTLRTADSATYTAVWRPASQLSLMGVTPTTLHVGDRIAITGSPARESSVRQLVTIRQVRRANDGWVWQLQGGRVSVQSPVPSAP